MHVLFSACSSRDDNVITSKCTWKLKHANSILEPSEYFCQISSKFIIISSYTISKLGRFFWDKVYIRIHYSIKPLHTLLHCGLWQLTAHRCLGRGWGCTCCGDRTHSGSTMTLSWPCTSTTYCVLSADRQSQSITGHRRRLVNGKAIHRW